MGCPMPFCVHSRIFSMQSKYSNDDNQMLHMKIRGLKKGDFLTQEKVLLDSPKLHQMRSLQL